MLSTVDLVFEHIGGRFETMLFPYDGDEVNGREQKETAQHEHICN